MTRLDNRILAPSLLGGVCWTTNALPALTSVCKAARGPFGVRDRLPEGTDTAYALTFDDGPHPQGTPAVLEALRSLGVVATFFLVGEQVRRNPSLVGEVLSAGHDGAGHCDRHRNLLRVTPRQVREDLTRASATIEEVSGRRARLYRPPYGVPSLAALRYARSRSWDTLLWTQWGRDWEARATPRAIAELLTGQARPGAVLLLHDADHYSSVDSWRRTAAALPLVGEELSRRGMRPTLA